MKMAVEAAHNVEVGDYYFGEKNYSGARMRYNDALEEKPGDLAIHVRLGRVLEKLNQIPQALEHYEAAEKLAGPEKWSDEAKSALRRLHLLLGFDSSEYARTNLTTIRQQRGLPTAGVKWSVGEPRLEPARKPTQGCTAHSGWT